MDEPLNSENRADEDHEEAVGLEYSHASGMMVVRTQSWNATRICATALRRWLFRGQRNASWPLSTTLERALRSRGLPLKRHGALEGLALAEFQAVAHNYASDVPADGDDLGWLALIQHHGGPTRLLDFTRSFYIAAFFATEYADTDCAVWAINRPRLMDHMQQLADTLAARAGFEGGSMKAKINAILRGVQSRAMSEKAVLVTTPNRRYERQVVQQGISVIPLDIEEGFIGSLLGAFSLGGHLPSEQSLKPWSDEATELLLAGTDVVKIVIPEACLLDARRELISMNISAATLFRGLDGLARSLLGTLIPLEEYEKFRDW